MPKPDSMMRALDKASTEDEPSEYESGAGAMAAEKLARLLKADKPDGAAILDQLRVCKEYLYEE